MWVNLPAKDKMTAPAYTGLQEPKIPTVTPDEGRISIHAVSGESAGTAGAMQPLTDIQLATINFQADGKLQLTISAERTVFFYTIRGKLRVNG